MRFLRSLILAGLLAAPGAAQLRLTVQQLSSFIESSIRLKHDDRRVAEYLKKVKLTEKLEDRTIETWQGLGAGPRTVEALRALGASSGELPAAAVAVKAAPVVIPPPSPEEQKRILAEVTEYALSYTKRLPDFICTQVTRRYGDPTGLEHWIAMDTVTERLSYFEQKEDYKVILVNNRPTEISHDSLGGASSSGEFGSMLHALFEPRTDAEFHWERWATLRGRRNHVYRYRVEQSRSQWSIQYEKTQRIVPGYQGAVYVDADLRTVTRITLEAIGIPSSFPIQMATTMLDYDFIKIGETEHVLPLRAEVRMRQGRDLSKNEVEFRLYRKFGAEATIKFDTPDPLPEDATKEQPGSAAPAAPMKKK